MYVCMYIYIYIYVYIYVYIYICIYIYGYTFGLECFDVEATLVQATLLESSFFVFFWQRTLRHAARCWRSRNSSDLMSGLLLNPLHFL